MQTNQELFRSLLSGENGEFVRKGLETSSVSEHDAETRAREWDVTFSNLDEIVSDRVYSTGAGVPGYSSNSLHGVEFFDGATRS